MLSYRVYAFDNPSVMVRLEIPPVWIYSGGYQEQWPLSGTAMPSGVGTEALRWLVYQMDGYYVVLRHPDWSDIIQYGL